MIIIVLDVLNAVVNQHHINQQQQCVKKNCLNCSSVLNIFLVSYEYIKYQRICVILKEVKAIKKKKFICSCMYVS